ncbi:MAG: cytidine deaminase [Pseudomonadota bacterium]
MSRNLMEMAEEAACRAYAPASSFRVGAALRGASGTVYTGCNIENASLGLSICAERVALFKAISEGEKRFTAIAVFAEEGDAPPCGACRQALAEFAPDIEVTYRMGGETVTRPIAELLPDCFNREGESG